MAKFKTDKSLNDDTAFAGAMAEIREAYVSASERLHTVLADCLARYYNSGTGADPIRFTLALNTLEKTGVDRTAISAWLQQFALLDVKVAKKDGKNVLKCVPMRDDDGKAVYPDHSTAKAGINTPFWNLQKSDPAPKPFDMIAEMAKLLAKQEKKQDKGEDVAEIPSAVLDRIRKDVTDALAAREGAKKVRVKPQNVAAE